ncbi:aldehyde dehydrogenase family protein [SAR92 clade bacterium H231]|nr:aldehyde dehydrogenase family protein [SAR92 clade bacterium H231]
MTIIDWHQRAKEVDFTISHLIDGEQIALTLGDAILKYAPRDGSLLYQLSKGTPAEMERAVASARQAYQDKRWRGLPLHQRQAALRKLGDLVDEQQEIFALYESLDAGKPITQALGEVTMASDMLREAADGADKLFSAYAADGAYCAYQLRKPVGVVGAIIPWNYPLVIAALKIAPALIMGNSLVLKPSEHTALSANYLVSLALEAGIPPGVLNLVHGAGPTVGETLAHHPDVDLLSFTGSTATGKKMQMAAGQSNMKRLLLECGGKSPYIIFDDCPADLDTLAADIVGTAFQNQSQNCMAGSRLLVQDSIKEKLLPKVIEQTKQLIPQDPLDPNSTFGAMIHEAHMNKVLAYIDSGEREGATRIVGGKRVYVDTDAEGSEGFYIEPTIFDNVNPQQKIAQEEIFGPVLSVLTFNTEQEAIALANNTCYGLAAYVATENLGRVQRLSQEINAGTVMFMSTFAPVESFRELGKEGHRESGFGIEGGLMGLMSYSLSTTVHHWT